MAQVSPTASSGAAEEFRGRLVRAGLLLPTGVDGLFGRSEAYEAVVGALSNMVHALGDGNGATVVSFPPVVARHVFERTGFPESFPNLVGAVRCFSGSDHEHARLLDALHAGADWSEQFGPSDFALGSAACHPVYPLCAGILPAGGRRFEVSCYCFRHEPSLDPTRMQAFRMYEHVYVGEPATALANRDDWLKVGVAALADLGLEVTTEPANDPFFGRERGSSPASSWKKSARSRSFPPCPATPPRPQWPPATGLRTTLGASSGSSWWAAKWRIRRAWPSGSTGSLWPCSPGTA